MNDDFGKGPWGDKAPPWLGDLLKRAVNLGADAYSSAGEKVQKTLNTVQAPLTFSREMLKETLESLLDSYTVEIHAKVDFVSKNKREAEKHEERKS